MHKSKSRAAIFSDLTTQDEPSPKNADEDEKRASLPSPADFDAFVPWVCTQWQVHDPVGVKIIREEHYVKFKGVKQKTTSLKSKSVGSTTRASTLRTPKDATEPSKLELCLNSIAVPVTANYESQNRLVEVSISNYHLLIPKKIFQAFCMCFPFQHYLTKFTISNCPLTPALILEISGLLLNSNLTDICLDGTFVPEANYYILLDEMCQLKFLSLNRCKINDNICKRMFQRLDYEYSAAKTLQLFDLGSNFITNKGAKFIGYILKSNRQLLHLNLSGNQITDKGLSAIMDSLKEFPLTYHEIMQMKRERVHFIKYKTTVYIRCLNEALNRPIPEDTLSQLTGKVSKFAKKPRKSCVEVLSTRKPEELAEVMTNDIVGEFRGAYGPQGIVTRDGYYYAKGNFNLCSLNVAYNNLGYMSVKKINEVLDYQCQYVMKPATGLMRVVIDGNRMPIACLEYENIEACLRKAVINNSPIVVPVKKRMSSNKMRQSCSRNM